MLGPPSPTEWSIMAVKSLLPVRLERLPHTSTRLELHSFASESVIRFACTERVDFRGEHIVREWGWRAPAATFLTYAESYTALRDHWDLTLPEIGFADRPRELVWTENPEWRKARNSPHRMPWTL